MPTFVADLLTQVKAIWARLDGGQRLTIVTVLVATAAGMGGLVWYAGQPDYVVLRGANTAAGRVEILKALQNAGIDSKVDGLSVSVPKAQSQQAEMALSDAGIGQEDEAESIINKLSSTAAGTKMRLFGKQLRVIEAKLKNSSLIRDVSILASQPKKNYFRRDQRHEKATVMITLNKGADFFTAARIACDATASGLGLPRSKVKVYDERSSATYVHDENGGGSAGGTAFLRMMEDWRWRLQALAENSLMHAFQDGVSVTVNLDLDKEATRKTGPNLPPEGLSPNSIETTEETSDAGPAGAANANPGGAPPASSGILAGQGSRSKTTNKTKKSMTAESLYGLKTVAQMAPFIEKISISVTIDQAVVDRLKDTKTPDEVKEGIEAIVKNSVGFKKDRDEITTQVFQFPDPLPVEEESGTDYLALAKDFAPAVGQVLAVLLVLFFLRGMLKKAQLGKKKEVPTHENPLEEELDENLAPEEVAQRMRREIENAISEDPAAISRMLDNWLTEQKA